MISNALFIYINNVMWYNKIWWYWYRIL